MAIELKLLIEDDEDERIDAYLSKEIKEISRNEIKEAIKNGSIRVNDKKVKPSYSLKQGDLVYINVEDEKKIELVPENLNLEIVYEDEYLAVINKPSGMVVHPGAGNKNGTLVNAILYEFGRVGNNEDEIRPGIVHRLDKDTSGLMLVAKEDEAYYKLIEMFRNKEVKRSYKALVNGVVSEDEGTIDEPIGRHPTNRQVMTVINKNSKNAITHYTVLDRFPNHTYIRADLETGRTHQIRVHMKYINHPIVGDQVYASGKNEFGLKKQFLHSAEIKFIHPITNQLIELKSDLPSDLSKILNNLIKRRDG